MASVNKVILVENLGRDPEIRYTPSYEAVNTYKQPNGREHAPTLSISGDMPESGAAGRPAR